MVAQVFPIEIDGIGKFIFREKTFRDQVKIASDASLTLGRRVSDLRPDEQELAVFALALAHLSTLTVEAPSGWDLEGLDPLDEESGARVITVYGRLIDELARFRRGRKSAGAATGAGA